MKVDMAFVRLLQPCDAASTACLAVWRRSKAKFDDRLLT